MWYRGLSAAHWQVQLMFLSDSTELWGHYSMDGMRGDRESSTAPGVLPTQPQHRESRGIQGLWERPGGLWPHSDHGLRVQQPWGRWKLHCQLQLWRISWNPSGTALQMLLGKASLTKGFFLTRLHWKTRIELLWQSVNHGNGRLSVARVICARSQDLLNPWGDSKFNDWAVLETRLKHHWQIWGGWEKIQRGSWVSPPYPFRKCNFST